MLSDFLSCVHRRADVRADVLSFSLFIDRVAFPHPRRRQVGRAVVPVPDNVVSVVRSRARAFSLWRFRCLRYDASACSRFPHRRLRCPFPRPRDMSVEVTI